tara:strand:+ start:961 stop:1206 length:246 start_codon:yes stop_codon:yes gene_type:complete
MGSMFKTPKPAEDPELKKRKAEQKRINEEEAARQQFEKKERIRKIATNKIGQRSLQSTELEDFTGFRRLNKTKNMGGGYNA